METTTKNTWLGLGTVFAAIGASLCCILPITVAVLGVGSAALGAKLEPLRPYLAALTITLLALAFYQAYKPRECAPGEECAVPASRRRQRSVLWIVTAIALALMAFPYYISFLL